MWKQLDAVVYRGWLIIVWKKYSELGSVSRAYWEKGEEPHSGLGQNVYEKWVIFWKSPYFQRKSMIQKNNHSDGADGHHSTHTSGSASHRTVAARWKMKYNWEPTADQVFLLTHTKRVKKKKNLQYGENGEDDDDDEDDLDFGVERIWADKKSQQTYETFPRLCELHEKVGEPVDKNAIFLEAAGGVDKKKRVYGVGSSQSIFYGSKITPTCSSSFRNAENQKLQDELKLMKDKIKEMENQIAKILEATSAQVVQSPNTPNADLESENNDE
ncbi:uncharacterized protein LOC141693933 [Apium graveolens]|uniref:uncharacterized protein LOC141693933 n=1 Tax=Apium graveolens TaxID=4045 RepID=UPI003D78EAE0